MNILPSLEDIRKNLNEIRIQLVLDNEDYREFRFHCFHNRVGISDGWVILTGIPDYDPFHGNAIASGIVTRDMTEDDIKELGINILSDLEFDWSEYRYSISDDALAFQDTDDELIDERLADRYASEH